MFMIALLLTATLFGGMVFYSFGFAPVLFKQLPMAQVRPLLRGTFPFYYLAILALSGAAMLAVFWISTKAAALIAAIFFSTIYAREILMKQINDATDRDDQSAFKKLHGLSVIIQVIQIGLAGWALTMLA